MACQQASTEPIPPRHLEDTEAAILAQQDIHPNGLPPATATDCIPNGNSADNTGTSAGARPLFVKPLDYGKRPYFHALCASNSSFENLKHIYGCSAPSQIPLSSGLNVYKENAAGVGVDLVEDPWALENSDQSDLFIFIEDLDPNIIETIGSSLQISPIVFEQHLRDSSYLEGLFRLRSIEKSDRYTGSDFRKVLADGRCESASASCVSLRWLSVASLSPIFQLCHERARNSDWKSQDIEGKMEWSADGRANSMTILNNIFRQPSPLPGNPIFSTSWCAWKEQATITVNQRGANRDVLVLTDPLPAIKYCSTKAPGSSTKEIELGEDWEDTAKSALEFRLDSRSPNRVGVPDGNSFSDHPYDSGLTEARSFCQDLSDKLQVCKAQGVKARPLDVTLEMVRTDTIILITCLDLFIEQVYEILQTKNGHEVLRREADTWRRLCFWAEYELPKISSSITETLQYLNEYDTQTAEKESSQSMLSLALKDKMENLVQRIRNTSTRVKATQEAINSEMALINSTRGIAEAENVKRLTELAFVFVPMTFVASVFSTQLQELQESPPRAWVFAVTAVCVMLFVYGSRLLQYLAIQGRWGRRLLLAWRNYQHLDLLTVCVYLFRCIRIISKLISNQHRSRGVEGGV